MSKTTTFDKTPSPPRSMSAEAIERAARADRDDLEGEIGMGRQKQASHDFRLCERQRAAARADAYGR